MQSNKARYHAEYHSKINSITLSVQVPPSGITCRIGPQAVDLIPSIQPGLNLDDENHLQGEEKGVAVTRDRLLLPARVMPTRTTLDPSSSRSNLLSLKLTALPNMPLETPNSSSLSAASTTEFPPSPLPASQLQGLENLACGSCGNILLSSTTSSGPGSPSGPIQRVVDLPSEHWQELVDCWMCHEEDFTELREGDLGARIGQALVGGTYLLIHAKDVEHHAVMIEEDARSIDWTKGIKRRWRPLACSRCLSPVGDGWYQSRLENGTDLEMIQVKFHKYLVRYHGRNQQAQQMLAIPRQRFSSYVATEIFESARHHATYRFILQDRLQGRDMLLLWMLNWDTTIVTNQEPLQDHQLSWDDSLRMDLNTTSSGRGKKVMKVLYLCAVPEGQDQQQSGGGVYSKEARLWDQWRGDPGVEKLEFQERLVLGLIAMLEQSSSCTPPGLNGATSAVMAMDGMRVGSFEI
ncbi:MAG: ubiquitin-conjugating enzyme E2-binding protein [Linnemannia elongata]|nr:MAG: ubiquitin-conjugating enzyme E2-binding protein [Linnemannia elongata]